MGTAFMLSWPLGIPIILSSYWYSDNNTGPPVTLESDDVIKAVERKADLSCGNGWTCEHRWRQIYNMVTFRSVVQGNGVKNWWTNGGHQVAYCLGNQGFIAFNNDPKQGLNLKNHQVCLPPGKYCERISGKLGEGNQNCTGEKPKIIEVNEGGFADIVLEANDIHGVIAIDTKASMKG